MKATEKGDPLTHPLMLPWRYHGKHYYLTTIASEGVTKINVCKRERERERERERWRRNYVVTVTRNHRMASDRTRDVYNRTSRKEN